MHFGLTKLILAQEVAGREKKITFLLPESKCHFRRSSFGDDILLVIVLGSSSGLRLLKAIFFVGQPLAMKAAAFSFAFLSSLMAAQYSRVCRGKIT